MPISHLHRRSTSATVTRRPVSKSERGYYFHPELFGRSENKAIEWVHHPEMMQGLKERREQTNLNYRSPAPEPMKSRNGDSR